MGAPVPRWSRARRRSDQCRGRGRKPDASGRVPSLAGQQGTICHVQVNHESQCIFVHVHELLISSDDFRLKAPPRGPDLMCWLSCCRRRSSGRARAPEDQHRSLEDQEDLYNEECEEVPRRPRSRQQMARGTCTSARSMQCRSSAASTAIAAASAISRSDMLPSHSAPQKSATAARVAKFGPPASVTTRWRRWRSSLR